MVLSIATNPLRPAGAPVLRVNALGTVEISVDGRPLPATAWGSTGARELLLYLVCHSAGCTRDEIGRAFWRDTSPAHRSNNFHVALHQLRGILGRPDWIVYEAQRYGINPRLVVEFDGFQFEAEVQATRAALAGTGDAAPLARALERYRGDFLEGTEAGDWHLEHRERWRRMYDEARSLLGARPDR